MVFIIAFDSMFQILACVIPHICLKMSIRSALLSKVLNFGQWNKLIEAKVCVAEMHILRSICEFTRKDRIKNE